MKSKLKFVLPVMVLVLLGGAYKTVLAKPKAAPKHKIDGQVYVLPKEFLLNLGDDRYAKLSVALVLPEGPIAAKGAEKEAVKPPEGFGPLPQEGAVRSIVTDTLTGVDSEKLIDPEGREELKEKLLKRIHKSTDVKAEDVMFTDVAVQ